MDHREFVLSMGEDYRAELIRKCRALTEYLERGIRAAADEADYVDMNDPDVMADMASDVLAMRDAGRVAWQAAHDLESGNITEEACRRAEAAAGAYDRHMAGEGFDQQP